MVSQTNEQVLENCIEWVLVEGSRYERATRLTAISVTFLSNPRLN